MKLDQLHYFVETARKEHIGQASKRLNISPSAISHSISQLEQELGQSLFTKQGKNIFLTEHGRLLLERADHILRNIDELKDEMSHDEVELRGHYRLAATHGLCQKILIPALSTLFKAAPGLLSESYSLRSAEVVAGVLKGEYDLGICFSPQDHPHLVREIFYEGDLLVMLAKNHPLLKVSKKQQIHQLHEFPALLPKAYGGIEGCEHHPVVHQYIQNPKIQMIYDSYEVAKEMLICSNAWSLIPDVFLTHFDYPLKSIEHPKQWDARYNISFIWSKNSRPSKAIRQLVEQVKENLALKTPSHLLS